MPRALSKNAQGLISSALTGLRNPCAQIDEFQPGLLARVALRDDDRIVVRKTKIIGVVILGGRVCPEDAIQIAAPPAPHVSMDRV